jgi:hypothetical protein
MFDSDDGFRYADLRVVGRGWEWCRWGVLRLQLSACEPGFELGKSLPTVRYPVLGKSSVSRSSRGDGKPDALSSSSASTSCAKIV